MAMGKKGFFAWFIGLLTGTALGVLFAPRKGQETRARIKKSRSEGGVGYEPMVDDLKDLGRDISDAASKAYEGSVLQDYIDQWKDKLNDFSDSLMEEAVPMKDEMEKRVRQGKRYVRKGKRAYSRAKRAVKQEFRKK